VILKEFLIKGNAKHAHLAAGNESNDLLTQKNIIIKICYIISQLKKLEDS
jgi:hypothetical protein